MLYINIFVLFIWVLELWKIHALNVVLWHYSLTFYCFVVSNAFSSSPWGENVKEPTPKLETGWANFDSSFGDPMVTNGDPEINHELFSDIVEHNTQNVTQPFESADNTNSSIKNLTGKGW